MDGQSQRLVRWTLRVWLTIGGSLLFAGVWWLLREPIGLVVPPLAIAAVLVYALNPGVNLLQRLGIARPFGTLATYLVAGTVVWIGLSLLGPLLADQVRELLDELPAIGASLQDAINAQLLRVGVAESALLDLDTGGIATSVQDWVAGNRDQVLELLRGAGSVVSWVVHLGLALALGPILAFYALTDLPRLSAGVGRLLPPDRRGEVIEVTSRIGRLVGSYFRGQLVVASFVGVATAIGLWAIGLPFWAVVGLTTGIFNLVPLVGPTTGAIIGGTIALTVGGGLRQAVLVIIVMVAVQQLDNHLITPLVISRSVSVHPITVILALIVAGSLGGIPLMFVAIPATATIKLVVLHVAVTRLPSMQHLADELDDGTEAARGTVAKLAQDLRAAFERRIERAEEEGGLLSLRHREGPDAADPDRDRGPAADADADPGAREPAEPLG